MISPRGQGKYANRRSVGQAIRARLALGLLRWANWLEALSVRVRQRAIWLKSRAAGDDQGGEQAADARPDPPPDWLARTTREGPPAHWVAYIRRKSPHLLANWRPGRPFPGLQLHRAGNIAQVAHRTHDVEMAGSLGEAEDGPSDSALAKGGLRDQAIPAMGQPVRTDRTDRISLRFLGRRKARVVGRGDPPAERAGASVSSAPLQPVEAAPEEDRQGQPRYMAEADSVSPLSPDGGGQQPSAARQRALLQRAPAQRAPAQQTLAQRARFRLRPSSSGLTERHAGAIKTERLPGGEPDAGIAAMGDQGIVPPDARILRQPSISGEKRSAQVGDMPSRSWQPSRSAPVDGMRLLAGDERSSARAVEVPAARWPLLPEESPPSHRPKAAAGPGEASASQGAGPTPLAVRGQRAAGAERQAHVQQPVADDLDERDYWPALPDYDETYEEGASVVEWERLLRARERLERLEREQRGQLWNG